MAEELSHVKTVTEGPESRLEIGGGGHTTFRIKALSITLQKAPKDGACDHTYQLP